tara:strand:- start:19 stop:531 length:513 start_codon:yes stop_codon:yes gene_type:complete
MLEEINKDHLKDISEEFTKFTNKFIKQITNNLESFSYNIIIANMHEMHSFLIKEVNKGYKKKTIIENYKKILITINPIIPHMSNECLEIIKENNEIDWPDYDEKFLEKKSNIIVVQINGKKRGLINAKANTSEAEIIKLINKDKNIKKYLINGNIKKQIYIKNKLINIII